MSSIYSDAGQLEHIAKIIRRYCQLPVSSEFVPGAFLEAVLAHVHDAEVLRTYDYVDVIDRKGRRGWSIKSTLERTPMTWKRAKLANKERLIDDSMAGDEGLQTLGDTIIDFCNKHAAESMQNTGSTNWAMPGLSCSPIGRRDISNASCAPATTRSFSSLGTFDGSGRPSV